MKREVPPRTRHLVQLYEQGPFPEAHVCEPPELMIDLYERFAGQTFDRRAFEAYERIRAFLAFQGVLLTPELTARQIHAPVAAPDPVQDPAEARRAAAISQRVRAITSGIDPSDLGD